MIENCVRTEAQSGKKNFALRTWSITSTLKTLSQFNRAAQVGWTTEGSSDHALLIMPPLYFVKQNEYCDADPFMAGSSMAASPPASSLLSTIHT